MKNTRMDVFKSSKGSENITILIRECHINGFKKKNTPTSQNRMLDECIYLKTQYHVFRTGKC